MGGFALGKPDTLIEFFDVFAFDSPFDFGEVGLGQAVLWMGETIGQVVIIGEDNQTRSIDVEPTNAEDSMACGDKVDGFCPALGVKIGADDALGFIKQEIDFWLGLNLFSCGYYSVLVDVRKGGNGIDDLTVDGDETFENHFLAFSA